MPNSTYLPSTEAGLLAWTTAFDEQINNTPEAFGLTVQQAGDYSTVYTAYAALYAQSQSGTTRTPAVIAGKNSAKIDLIENTRVLVNIIQATPGVTNQQKAGLQITVRDTDPTPVPVPSTAPQMTILSTVGRTVSVRLRDAENPDSRARPEGVIGATIMMFAGATPPEDPIDWSFLANTTKTEFQESIPLSVPADSTVWLSAFWYNTKSQSGPPSPGVSTIIRAAMPA